MDSPQVVTYWRVWDNPKNGRRYQGWHVRTLRPVTHGTVAGYAAELRRRVRPCDACREAMRVSKAELRARPGEASDV